MLFSNSRNGQSLKASSKTAQNVGKIRDLLSRALGEVHDDYLRLKKRPSFSPNKRKSDESSQSESINEVLANLRKGYLMIKHSQRNIEPHNKFIYISEDSRCLCWKSTEKDDEKQIELCSITKVVKEGAEYYLKGNRIRDINRCLVILGEERVLQLQAGSQIQAEYLKYQLQRAIKHSKSMKLNYKYWKNS